MRKMFCLLAGLCLLLCGCQSSDVSARQSPAQATLMVIHPDATPQPEQTAVSAAVLYPHELLSAQEAATVVGYPVTLEEGSLSEDPDSGIISERYVYDIDDTTIHALVQIEQNSFKPQDSAVEGNTAQASFAAEKALSADELSAVTGIGDEAFVFTTTGQLHMLYQDYYIVIAFDADAYSTDRNAALNTQLGGILLNHLKEKVG